jgi:hypothetical protein
MNLFNKPLTPAECLAVFRVLNVPLTERRVISVHSGTVFLMSNDLDDRAYNVLSGIFVSWGEGKHLRIDLPASMNFTKMDEERLALNTMGYRRS